jgi:hypothetical protein
MRSKKVTNNNWFEGLAIEPSNQLKQHLNEWSAAHIEEAAFYCLHIAAE